jgi:iron complex transport system permease protein
MRGRVATGLTVPARAVSTRAAATEPATRPEPPRLQPGGLPLRWIVFAVVIVLAAATAGLLVGAAALPPRGVLAEVLGRITGRGSSALTERQQAVLWQLRAPRVALGLVVGAALAVSGAAYQGVFDNPLADPYLLGVASGAGLGATLAVAAASGASALLPLAAFAGAVGAVAATYLLGRSVGGRGTTSLILAGVAVAAFAQAVQTYVQQRNADTLREVYSWLLGDLSSAGWGDLALITPYVLGSTVIILAHRRLLDALRLGETEARALGLQTTRIRLAVVAAATLATAAAVAVSGLIGFVGIVVPHTVRMLAGASNAVVLPLSALVGAAFLVLADIAARSVATPAEVPIGVITAAVGAPFFAIVLRARRRDLR